MINDFEDTIYFDMLKGNCCCFCLSEFYESDNRTPASKAIPTICELCLNETELQVRRMWFGVTPICYKNQRGIKLTGQIPKREILVRKVAGRKIFKVEEIYIPKRFKKSILNQQNFRKLF